MSKRKTPDNDIAARLVDDDVKEDMGEDEGGEEQGDEDDGNAAAPVDTNDDDDEDGDDDDDDDAERVEEGEEENSSDDTDDDNNDNDDDDDDYDDEYHNHDDDDDASEEESLTNLPLILNSYDVRSRNTILQHTNLLPDIVSRILLHYVSFSGKKRITWRGHKKEIRCVAVLPDGKFCTGSYDKSIKIWDRNGACLQTLKGIARYKILK